MAAPSESSADGKSLHGNGECGISEPCVRGSHGSYGSSTALSLSDPVTVYHEAGTDGKACLCDGGALHWIYGDLTWRKRSIILYLVLLSARAGDPVFAGGDLFLQYVFNGKGTESLYAGIRDCGGCLVCTVGFTKKEKGLVCYEISGSEE